MPERNLNFSRSGEKIFLFTTFIFKAFIYFLKANFAKYGIQLDTVYICIYSTLLSILIIIILKDKGGKVNFFFKVNKFISTLY